MLNARPDWTTIDHVLLDMDGTILDLAFDSYFWRELVPERYAAARGLTIDQALDELQPKFHAIAHTLPWYCTDYWSEVTGLNLAALKHEIRDRVRPLAGSVEFLRAIKESGRPLWLATNAHRDSWSLKLRETGLTPYFDQIVCSHDYGAPKEDPRFWQQLQAQHPFDRKRALFVDDSLPVLQAARAYGIGQVIAIRHPDTTQPERLVEEFPSTVSLHALLPLA